jgi:hypothetical protein
MKLFLAVIVAIAVFVVFRMLGFLQNVPVVLR